MTDEPTLIRMAYALREWSAAEATGTLCEVGWRPERDIWMQAAKIARLHVPSSPSAASEADMRRCRDDIAHALEQMGRAAGES